MPVFPTFEIYDDVDDVWLPINDYVVGEAVFTEGRDISSLGGALPTIAASTLTLSLDNFYGDLDKGQLGRALRIGSEGRLKVGSTPTTSLTRFQGRLTKRDSQDGKTYSVEWADELWKFAAGRNNESINFRNTRINDIWVQLCQYSGIDVNKVYADDFGQDKYSPVLPVGKTGFQLLQDLSGGAIWPAVNGGLYLQSGELREARRATRTYYEPGGKVDGVAVPKVRRIQNTSGIVNDVPVIARVTFPDQFSSGNETKPADDVIINLGTVRYLPLGLGPLGASFFQGAYFNVFTADDSLGPIRAFLQDLRFNWPNILRGGTFVSSRFMLINVVPVRDGDIKSLYTGSVSVTGVVEGIIPDEATIGFAGFLNITEPILTPDFSDLQFKFEGFGETRQKGIAMDTDGKTSMEGTYTWNYSQIGGLITFQTILKISNARITHTGREITLTFDYTGSTRKTTAGQTPRVESATRAIHLSGNFTAEVVSDAGVTTTRDYPVARFEDKDSIRKYGRRQREFPATIDIEANSPLAEDYYPSEIDTILAKIKAYNELAVYSEPAEVFSVLHTDDSGIISRRLGDKEKLELESGSYELFVENMETHFSGVNTWQVAYYANEKVLSLLPPPSIPVPAMPFVLAARWNVRTLEVTITDYGSSKGEVEYTLVTEREDGGKPFADREVTSALPAPPAAQVAQATSEYETSSTLADVQDIHRLTAIRKSDGFEVSLLASEFTGTYVPSDAYPDFIISARWSNEQLIVGISEKLPTTQPNFGNNEYRIAWYGGVPGNTVVTSSASRGGVSYTIASTFGITSIRVTQIATGITKVILAKDFAGMGYTPRAFTTQWTKITGSNTNYFYYRGWIQDNPSSVGGLAYSVAFEDVTGVTFTWEARVVSDSTGRATPGVVGHTRAISVMIITRLIDGYIVRFPFPNVAPPTGGDELAAYNFTATWSQRSLVLRVQERGPSEDLGGTEFRLTSSGLSPELNVTRTTNALGRISYRIPDASSIQSVTATRTGDNDSVTILRKDFYGTYIAPAFTTSINEVRRNGTPDRYTYTIGITDAAGVNSATRYRVEGTFAKFRQFITTTTSVNVSGTWRAAVNASRHSQGFSNITVTRLTDNTVQSINRDNYNRKASNNPQFSVVVDEDNDGTRQGIQLYSYAVLITDPSSTVGGSIYYKVEYVQGGITLEASEVQTARNGEVTVRFGTERTTASSVKVTRDWDGRVITVPRSSFNRE